MAARIHHGATMITGRVVIFVILVATAFLFHKIFSLFGQEIIGALLFIVLFSVGMVYYYFNLSNKKGASRREYLASIFFVLFLIITMFAIIYSEPIENSNNYFLEFGQPTNLTFADAFYFSTTTITTVGYGDIVPVGIFRLMVSIEVFMGLIYTGSMVYFLTKAFEEEEIKEISQIEKASGRSNASRKRKQK